MTVPDLSRRDAAIESDLLACLDALAKQFPDAPHALVSAYLEQREFTLAREALRDWLMESGAAAPAQALRALARADLASQLTRKE